MRRYSASASSRTRRSSASARSKYCAASSAPAIGNAESTVDTSLSHVRRPLSSAFSRDIHPRSTPTG
jgi:hypothetical protein